MLARVLKKVTQHLSLAVHSVEGNNKITGPITHQAQLPQLPKIPLLPKYVKPQKTPDLENHLDTNSSVDEVASILGETFTDFPEGC